MHWKKSSLATLTAAALGVLSVPALAGGDATGSLGSGGILKGDISMTVGETDRITIDLVAGAPLNVTFTARFGASFTFSDPDGAPVDIGTTGPKVRLRGFPITRGGTYTFTVSSADGSQGFYTLSVAQTWSRAIPVSGAGPATIDVPMPATGKFAATIRRERGAAGDPRILSLLDPSATEMLAAPVEPRRHVVRLVATPALAAGNFQLVVTATDETSAWRGLVRRVVPRAKPFRTSILNGIDAISFSEDGVDDFFKRTCSPCHSWARSYAGVKSIATSAYSKMKAGTMPPGGPRIPAAQLSLVQSWIQTGRAP